MKTAGRQYMNITPFYKKILHIMAFVVIAAFFLPVACWAMYSASYGILEFFGVPHDVLVPAAGSTATIIGLAYMLTAGVITAYMVDQ